MCVSLKQKKIYPEDRSYNNKQNTETSKTSKHYTVAIHLNITMFQNI